jgi:hypothetical protein
MIGLDEPLMGLTTKSKSECKIVGWENGKNPIISYTILGHEFHLKFDATTKLLHVKKSDIPEDIRELLLQTIKSNNKIILE